MMNCRPFGTPQQNGIDSLRKALSGTFSLYSGEGDIDFRFDTGRTPACCVVNYIVDLSVRGLPPDNVG